MKSNVITLSGEKKAEIELSEEVFGQELRKDILHRVVEWQRAKKRAGTHKTKIISEVSGTTAKPFRQKGTGNARQGSRRAPHMRGGAVVFGPQVRSHAYSLNKKFRRLGLKIALSQKLAEGKLKIVEDFSVPQGKTKEVISHIKPLGLKSALFIGDNDGQFALALRNVKFLDVLPQIGANVYDILRHDELVLTVGAVKSLEERLK